MSFSFAAPLPLPEIVTAALGSGLTLLGLHLKNRAAAPRVAAEARKTDTEARAAEWQAITDTLQEQVTLLSSARADEQKEMERLRRESGEMVKDLARCETKHLAAQAEIERLKEELDRQATLLLQLQQNFETLLAHLRALGGTDGLAGSHAHPAAHAPDPKLSVPQPLTHLAGGAQ